MIVERREPCECRILWLPLLNETFVIALASTCDCMEGGNDVMFCERRGDSRVNLAVVNEFNRQCPRDRLDVALLHFGFVPSDLHMYLFEMLKKLPCFRHQCTSLDMICRQDIEVVFRSSYRSILLMAFHNQTLLFSSEEQTNFVAKMSLLRPHAVPWFVWLTMTLTVIAHADVLLQ